MRILIVEHEIYLAGSIASKLSDLGHECEISSSVKEALKGENYDVVLLSTTMNGQDFYPVIEKFKYSIIILLIAYISSDTVLYPLQAGANDYIQKPFMIEELIRKINHFEKYRQTKYSLKFQQSYIENFLKNFSIGEQDFKRFKLPLLLRVPKQGYADKFVFEYTRQNDIACTLIFANSLDQVKAELKAAKTDLIYISSIHNLSEVEREVLFETCRKKHIILSTNNFEQHSPFESVNIAQGEKAFSIDEIATIDEYIKHVISTYQDRLPDTELSKRLGISRKSLWEKRKKYEIAKKK
ncbi:MAG: response regulator [Campylobacter sp.]|nr:response regulator [Campylobacter sp.]